MIQMMDEQPLLSSQPLLPVKLPKPLPPHPPPQNTSKRIIQIQLLPPKLFVFAGVLQPHPHCVKSLMIYLQNFVYATFYVECLSFVRK